MTTENKYRIITNIILTVVLGLSVYFGIKYAAVLLLPFLLGLFIAFLLKPIIRSLASFFHIRRKISAAVTIILTYAVLGGILWWAGNLLFWQLFLLFQKLPDFFSKEILPVINKFIEFIALKIEMFSGVPAEDVIDISPDKIIPVITDYSAKAVSSCSKFLSKLPSVFIGVVFTVVSSVFISIDYSNIVSFITKQFSPKIRTCIFQIKDFLVNTAFKLLKAYVILMAITFVELSVAFLLLRIPMAIPVAFLIALADFLPLIGTGGVMIPWIIFEVLRSNYILAISLGIVYAIVALVRNIAEPKIVGAQVGLHPLVTIMGMYIGGKIFGFLGIFILPMLILIAKELNDTGKVHLWKK